MKKSRSNRHTQATEFKVEFWTEASGKPRRHRSRYYTTAEGMIRAGARWEARGSDYYCRYWNGLATWQSSTRNMLQTEPPPGAVTVKPDRPRGSPSRRSSVKFYSIFGQIERVAAEIMIKEGKVKRIPKEEIPESALYNEHGDVASFAIMLPINLDPEFNNLCRDLRA